jgi:FkbM family methyltransferase
MYKKQLPKSLNRLGLPEEIWWADGDEGAFGNYEERQSKSGPIAVRGDGPAYELYTHHLEWLQHTPKRSVCIQAGGCMGLYAMFYALHFDHVIVFEPSPKNFEVCKANVDDYQNITLINEALSDFPGALQMKTDYPNNHGEHRVEDVGDTQVISTTLDSVISKYGINDVALIHLDIENHEGRAVAGSKHTIDQFLPTVICEDQRQVGTFFKSRGYQHLRAHDHIYYR